MKFLSCCPTLKEKETTDMAQPMVKQFISGTFRCNYIKNTRHSRGLRFHAHCLGEHGWCSDESDRFSFGLLPYVRDGDLKSHDVFKGK